ncbi:hypothetical protein ACMD2_07502 [Ananas comosus]|uniref:Uncharacterized protein n=1 Tax=Ananas comosus TaxID=4615 RepID=A0A199W0M1_ANACO|nr:hypothetical protein ACMD2_25973 [Ananas comosus]OAY82465.1 hypothetical protein ACMD2_07502 [Ananas comosus]
MRSPGIVARSLIMPANARMALSGSSSNSFSTILVYAVSWRRSSAAMSPQSLARVMSPRSLACRAVLPCDTNVALSWNDPAAEVEVAGEHVAVSVLLGGPAPVPLRPRGGAGPCLVVCPVEPVRHALVRRQRLLRHQVAHQAHVILVGDPCRPLPELSHGIEEFLRRR